MASGGISFELNNSRDWQRIMNQLVKVVKDFDKVVDQLGNSLDSMEGDLKDTGSTARSTERDIENVTKTTRKMGSETKRATDEGHSGFSKLFNFISTNAPRVATAIIGMTTAAAGMAAGFTAYSAMAFVSWEDAFAGVVKTVDATEEQLDFLENRIRDMATDETNPVAGLENAAITMAKIAEQAGQLGIATDAIDEFTEIIAKLRIAAPELGEEAAVSLGQVMNILQLPIEDFDNLVSVIVELGNKMATDERTILDFMQRLAAAGNVAGFSSDQIAALGAAMGSVGINPEAGGTAMVGLLNEITKAAAAGEEDLSGFNAVVDYSAEAFSNLWANDPTRLLQEIISGVAELNSAEQIAFLDSINMDGARASLVLQSLASAGDLTAQAFSFANEEFERNTALNAEAAKRFETTRSQINLFKNNFKELAFTIGEAVNPALREMVGLANEAIDVIQAGLPAFFELVGLETGGGGAEETTVTEQDQRINNLLASRQARLEHIKELQDQINAGIETQVRHTVQAGDTAWDLARQYNTTVDAIIEANNLAEDGRIFTGTELIIPTADTEASDRALENEQRRLELINQEIEDINSQTIAPQVPASEQSPLQQFAERLDQDQGRIGEAYDIVKRKSTELRDTIVETVGSEGFQSGITSLEAFVGAFERLGTLLGNAALDTGLALLETAFNAVIGGVALLEPFMAGAAPIIDNFTQSIDTFVSSMEDVDPEDAENAGKFFERLWNALSPFLVGGAVLLLAPFAAGLAAIMMALSVLDEVPATTIELLSELEQLFESLSEGDFGGAATNIGDIFTTLQDFIVHGNQDMLNALADFIDGLSAATGIDLSWLSDAIRDFGDFIGQLDSAGISSGLDAWSGVWDSFTVGLDLISANVDIQLNKLERTLLIGGKELLETVTWLLRNLNKLDVGELLGVGIVPDSVIDDVEDSLDDLKDSIEDKGAEIAQTIFDRDIQISGVSSDRYMQIWGDYGQDAANAYRDAAIAALDTAGIDNAQKGQLLDALAGMMDAGALGDLLSTQINAMLGEVSMAGIQVPAISEIEVIGTDAQGRDIVDPASVQAYYDNALASIQTQIDSGELTGEQLILAVNARVQLSELTTGEEGAITAEEFNLLQDAGVSMEDIEAQSETIGMNSVDMFRSGWDANAPGLFTSVQTTVDGVTGELDTIGQQSTANADQVTTDMARMPVAVQTAADQMADPVSAMVFQVDRIKNAWGAATERVIAYGRALEGIGIPVEVQAAMPTGAATVPPPPAGTGRALGGDVTPGKMYEIDEPQTGGIELMRQDNGRLFLISNRDAYIEPATQVPSGGGSSLVYSPSVTIGDNAGVTYDQVRAILYEISQNVVNQMTGGEPINSRLTRAGAV